MTDHNMAPKSRTNKGKPTGMIEPKSIGLDIMYAITINPNDDFQFWTDPESERIKKATNHLKYVIKHNPNYDFHLVIDVSRIGRIHWHGTIRFKHLNHVRMFYTEFLHDFLSKHHLDMDTIKDPVVWNSYMYKTSHLWSNELTTVSVCKIPIVNKSKIYKDITQY